MPHGIFAQVAPERLSDDSYNYNVHFEATGIDQQGRHRNVTVSLNAVDCRSAGRIAATLNELFNSNAFIDASIED